MRWTAKAMPEPANRVGYNSRQRRLGSVMGRNPALERGSRARGECDEDDLVCSGPDGQQRCAGPGHHGRPNHYRRDDGDGAADGRSEEHTSELQSLMRSSYAVFCLKKKKKN